MSNTIASDSSSTMYSMEVAMSKRAQDVQGQQALAMIQGAVQTVQAAQSVQAQAPDSPVNQPVSEGTLGTNINLHV
ncbi:MAG: hypothetical protein PUI29_01535 [Aeromonadales bacterium]|nr:hypothetical protein [Aeromonadales bacterium]MDY2891887.1 hypothetical protein [Succinivibrio sp.]